MPDAIAGMAASPQMVGNHAATESALHSLTGIGSDGFLRLLVAQLQYQSPLEPSDPGDLMLQTAQLAQLDATMQMVGLQQRDLGLQQAVLAASMVGSEVTAAGPDGTLIRGVVDAVRFTAMGPVLSVGGQEVVLAAVTEVHHNEPPPIPVEVDLGDLLDGGDEGTGGTEGAEGAEGADGTQGVGGSIGIDDGAEAADPGPTDPDQTDPDQTDPDQTDDQTDPDQTDPDQTDNSDDPTGSDQDATDDVLAAPVPTDDDSTDASDTDAAADGSDDDAAGVATDA